jgi:flavin-binding protein dodecin
LKWNTHNDLTASHGIRCHDGDLGVGAVENHVYKQIEITGSSAESSDDAIRKAIAKAGQSVRHMDWFNVIETRGCIEQSAVKYWQVLIKVGFRIED